MKKVGLLAVFAVAVAAIVTSSLFLHRADEIVTPSVTPNKTIPPPGTEAAKLFFSREPYEKRISLLMPEVTKNLLKFRDQFELLPTLTTYDVLPPIWQKGNSYATVHLQVKDYPSPGSIGLALIKMNYVNDEWHLNLFGGETSFALLLTNCLDSPTASAISFFSTENAIARKPYIFEEAVKSLDPADRNPLPEFVPYSQWMLDELISVKEVGGVADAVLVLKSIKGIKRRQAITLKKLLHRWYYYRGDGQDER